MHVKGPVVRVDYGNTSSLFKPDNNHRKPPQNKNNNPLHTHTYNPTHTLAPLPLPLSLPPPPSPPSLSPPWPDTGGRALPWSPGTGPRSSDGSGSRPAPGTSPARGCRCAPPPSPAAWPWPAPPAPPPWCWPGPASAAPARPAPTRGSAARQWGRWSPGCGCWQCPGSTTRAPRCTWGGTGCSHTAAGSPAPCPGWRTPPSGAASVAFTTALQFEWVGVCMCLCVCVCVGGGGVQIFFIAYDCLTKCSGLPHVQQQHERFCPVKWHRNIHLMPKLTLFYKTAWMPLIQWEAHNFIYTVLFSSFFSSPLCRAVHLPGGGFSETPDGRPSSWQWEKTPPLQLLLQTFTL